MTNIVLGHCYTTKNKGDAGIVIATIETIKAHAPDARLAGISTFSSRDDEFAHHHGDYEAAGAKMVPALLPEDKLHLFGRTLTSSPAKLLSFVMNCYLLAQGMLLFRLNRNWAPGDVGRALSALADADIFISKGGSFLCNEGGFRGDLSLFKLLVPFWVAKSLGLRTIVLSQSLGPFESRLSRWMFGVFLRYIDRLYLRESHCLGYLAYLPPEAYENKIDDCPDMAFALSSEGFPPLFEVEDGTDHVGLTIVNHRFADDAARQAYVTVIGKAVAYLRDRLGGTRFHIFPQVLSPATDGTVDLQLSGAVVDHCRRAHGIEVDLIEGDFDARVLRETYRRMRFFVATRLHSSIFAASAGVPTIVFGYHGTKAEGIWHDLGFSELFFDINTVDWPQVEAALETLLASEKDISRRLAERTGAWRQRIDEVVGNELARYS